MLRFYAYKGCDGCRKARKWLSINGVQFIEIAIRETPPSLTELTQALEEAGNIRKLFNTSGVDYRELRMKDMLSTMTDDDALKKLTSNGNLVKRPFLTGKDVSLIGFQENVWYETLKS